MNELNFDSGIVTYKINGKCDVSFNPTDTMFIDKAFSVFEQLVEMQDGAGKEAERFTGSKDELFKHANIRESKMREKLDTLFGHPICAELFDNISIYALAGGLPLWANLMLAVVDKMDDAVVSEQGKANPRLNKYIAKYDKYKKK